MFELFHLRGGLPGVRPEGWISTGVRKAFDLISVIRREVETEKVYGSADGLRIEAGGRVAEPFRLCSGGIHQRDAGATLGVPGWRLPITVRG